MVTKFMFREVFSCVRVGKKVKGLSIAKQRYRRYSFQVEYLLGVGGVT
jgi:hypothetical protein